MIYGWIEETISGTKDYNKRRLGKLLRKLKKDEYDRVMTDSDIIAVLAAKPNVSIASV